MTQFTLDDNTIVSKKNISRLSRYRKALIHFKQLGFVKVFSDTLGEAVGVTSAQVRKDFSLFGISGNKRGGYKIEELIEHLQNILGKDQIQDVIVAGAGNIGSALMKYHEFEKEGIRIIAGFDIDPAKINEKAKIPVFHLNEMGTFIKTHEIKVGIIAVPDIAAQQICDFMVSSGITGILNFAPIRLKSNEDVIINTVNVQMELENIIYFVNALSKSTKPA